MSTTIADPVPRAPDTGADDRLRQYLLPPYSVILHNDDHNDMLYVVSCLVQAVRGMDHEHALQIMQEAHTRGRALVTTCPLELAELYRDRLESFGLTATIEKVG